MESVYIPAITYHQVLSEDMPVLARKPGEEVLSGQIYLADFVRHMDFLSEQGFTTITHDQLYRWRIGVGELGPRPIVIDFDDHSMTSYRNALPVMRERGQVATMFVISGLADGDPSLSSDCWSVARMRWRELEQLLESGWEIGAHTRSHLYLTTVPEGPEGDARIMYELVRGRVDIEVNLGVAPRHFAYPNGLWNERIEMMVKQVYASARLFVGVGRAEYITLDTDPYRLPTMNVNYLLPFEDFRRLANRTDPEHEYYPESRVIGHKGSLK
jgi:peptidoglycan/xylan/chitin deacetylase (PgdA/CDA1 family)